MMNVKLCLNAGIDFDRRFSSVFRKNPGLCEQNNLKFYQNPKRKLSCQKMAELSNSALLAKNWLYDFLKSKT
jgi:hypothetical protein